MSRDDRAQAIVWADDYFIVKVARTSFRRPRLFIHGPDSVPKPTLPHDKADPIAVAVWRSYRRQHVKRLRVLAREALRRTGFWVAELPSLPLDREGLLFTLDSGRHDVFVTIRKEVEYL